MLIVTKGFTWGAFTETVAGCLVGIVMLAAALTGYGVATMRMWERLLLGFASVLVISPSRTATIVGLALGVPIIMRQIADWRAGRGQATPMTAGKA